MSKIVVNPIIDWTLLEVWDFIFEYKLPYCSLYDQGFTRIGCILCPCTSVRIKHLEADRWPRFYRAYLRCFNRMLEKRRADGKKITNWHTGQDVMDWWIGR